MSNQWVAQRRRRNARGGYRKDEYLLGYKFTC